MAMTRSEPVVKVIGSGLASLETIPFIIEEMVRGQVPILKPRAMDHDRETIERFTKRLDPLLKAYGYEFSADDCVEPIFGQLATREGIRKRNPAFYDLEHLDDIGQVEMYDRPCALAEWAEQHATRIWQEIWVEWMEYRNNHPGNNRLVVLIPYCPEGPTSGSVGIMLGSHLLNRVRELRRRGDLENLQVRVYGIELCPPMRYDDTKNDQNSLDNSFRGYVARQELLGDQISPRSFDAIFAVDVGREFYTSQIREELLEGLDRAAARVALAVVRGALGRDQGESDTQIQWAWRWQVVPLQIRTDPFELEVLPVLGEFPEVTANSAETLAVLNQYHQASEHLSEVYQLPAIRSGFGRYGIAEPAIRDIRLAGEVWKDKHTSLRQASEKHTGIQKRRDKWYLPLRRPTRRELQEAARELSNARAELISAAHSAHLAKSHVENNIGPAELNWKPRILGYEVELSKNEVSEYLREPRPLYKLMTTLNSKDLTNGLSEKVASYLSRYVWRPDNHPGATEAGRFTKVVVTTVSDAGNRGFSPTREALAIHTLAASDRQVYVQDPNQGLIDIRSDIETHLGCDIFVFAADAELADVASYQDLSRVYHEVTGDIKRWYGSVRFYMINIPERLLEHHRKETGQVTDEPTKTGTTAQPVTSPSNEEPHPGNQVASVLDSALEVVDHSADSQEA